MDSLISSFDLIACVYWSWRLMSNVDGDGDQASNRLIELILSYAAFPAAETLLCTSVNPLSET